METDGRKPADGKRGLKSSFAAGIAALVFIVIGYQSALFIHRAAVLGILDRKDVPDTVFVIDKTMAGRILDAVPKEQLVNHEQKLRGKDVYVIRKNAVHEPEVEAVRQKAAPRIVESFRFNPNTVSVDDLVRLGFSRRQAVAIDNYRKKGGRFRRRSDFAKSYVVADSVFRRLEPYIDIPRVDLNLADSAAFDGLPGIGGYFAAKMTEYRKSLGGSYSYKEQLMDIRGFDRERFDGLSDLIEISSPKPYALWTLPEDSLELHPYIGTYAAHGIVLFRENNPREKWTVSALDATGVLKPGMAEKLSRCLIAAP